MKGIRTFEAFTSMYIEGFRSMRLGKTLWLLVGLKLLVMFAVLKLLFFPDVLHERFETDAQRSGFVLDHLTTQGVR